MAGKHPARIGLALGSLAGRNPALSKSFANDHPAQHSPLMSSYMAGEIISLDQLRAGSLIEELAGSSPNRVDAIDIRGTRAYVTRAPDVTYLPDSHIQIVDSRLVPLEANANGRLALRIMQLGAREHEFRGSYLPSEFEYVDAEVCILSNIFTESFFHWMEEMYKVAVLERIGFQGYYVLHSLPEYPVGWLDLFGVGAGRIIRQLAGPTIFRSAVFTTGFAHEDVSTFPGVFDQLRDTILGAVPSDDPMPAGRRLWLERGVNTFGGARDVVNAEEVRQCCDRYGFSAIDLGSLPAREQVAAVRNADVLAGPHGAAFVHAMWLREHATVVECFSPKHNDPSIFEICRLLRHRYFQLVHYDMPFRPYKHGNDVLIDLSHLNLTSEEIERG
jgi:hypothetical protein